MNNEFTFIPTPLHFNSVERGIKEGLHLVSGLYPDVGPLGVEAIMDKIRKLTVLSVCLQHIDAMQDGELDINIRSETEYLLNNKLSNKELSAIELLKGIECILAQVQFEPIEDIRDIEEEERFALSFLFNYINYLKDLIIQSIPEFDKAPWEIE